MRYTRLLITGFVVVISLNATADDSGSRPKPSVNEGPWWVGRPEDQVARLGRMIQEERRLVGHESEVCSVSFSHDGTRGLSGGVDGTVRLWDLQDGRELRRYAHDAKGAIRCVHMSSDGTNIYAGGDAKTLFIWDLKTGEQRQRLAGHGAAIHQVAVSKDGTVVVTTDRNGEIRRWNPSDGTGEKLLEGSPKATQLIRPILLKSTLVSVTGNDEYSIWDVTTWERTERRGKIWPLLDCDCPPAVSQDEQKVAGVVPGTQGSLMRLGRTLDFGEERGSAPDRGIWWAISTSQSKLERVKDVQFLIKDRYLKLYAGGGAVESWKLEDLVEHHGLAFRSAGQFPEASQGVSAAALSPDGLRGLTGYDDGKLAVWRLPPPRYDPMDSLGLWAWSLRELLQNSRFEELDKLLSDLRRRQIVSPTCEDLLEVAYRALSTPPGEEPDEAAWNAHGRLLEQWRKAKPTSVSPWIVIARVQSDQGWNARGEGLAFTVGPDAWRLFQERVTLSREAIEQAISIDPSDPEIYRLTIQAGLAGLLPREAVEAAFEKGKSLERPYVPLYEAMVTYLLPRWHGEPGEAYRWIEEVTTPENPESDALYTLLAMVLMTAERYMTDDSPRFLPPRLERGMKKLVREFPEAPVIANYEALLAKRNDDPAAAREALARVNEREAFYESIWGTTSRLEIVRRWARPDFPRGQERRVIQAYRYPVLDLFLRPSSEDFVSLGIDAGSQAKIWNAQSGEFVDRIGSALGKMNAGAFDVDKGQLIVAIREPGGPRFDIQMWNLAPPENIGSIRCGPEHVVSDVSISSNGSLFASGDHGNQAVIWNRDKGTVRHALAHDGPVVGVEFSPDGKTLATFTTGAGRAAYLWNVADGKRLHTMEAWNAISNSLRFSPDGKLVTLVDRKGSLLLCDAATGQTVTTMGLVEAPYAVAFSPDGKFIAVGGGRHKFVIMVLDLSAKKTVKMFEGHAGLIRALTFSEDGETIVSGADDGSIRIWDVASPEK